MHPVLGLFQSEQSEDFSLRFRTVHLDFSCFIKAFLLILLSALIVAPCPAKKITEKQLKFNLVFGGQILKLDPNGSLLNLGDSLQIETIRFYVFGIELLQNTRSVWKEANSFHLLDGSVASSLTLPLQIENNLSFNRLRFVIGIDSAVNSSGAMGGDLDPTKGMYWTWDNGYINVKLEGRSALCKTKDQQFQFHLGGYRKEVNTAMVLEFPSSANSDMSIEVDIKAFFSKLDLSKTNQIMSPGKEAVLLSQYFAQCIRFQ